MASKLLFGLMLVFWILMTWLYTQVYAKLTTIYDFTDHTVSTSWIFLLLLNMMGYATILLPLFVTYKYLERTKYFDKIGSMGSYSRVLFACFGEPNERLPESSKPAAEELAKKWPGAELAFCFIGLMGSYLIWGLVQEKIMTQKYTGVDISKTGTQTFNDPQFLVFINRLSALIIVSARLACRRHTALAVPLYKYSYCSVTNIISAWCQYEALKYVSFPTQVLSKSCKVIPVMLMGKLVSNNKYEVYEYVTAIMISLGMALFMLGSHDDKPETSSSAALTMSGVALLALYLSCDSFTSSWQAALFSRYRVSPAVMLAGVNLFSCALTAATLLLRPDFDRSTAFLLDPAFVADCTLLSLSSATGQIFIFRTIAKFGAVAFAIIMTLRQAVSIILSCLVFGHRVSVSGVVGVASVFLAVLLRVYCRQRLRRRCAHV